MKAEHRYSFLCSFAAGSIFGILMMWIMAPTHTGRIWQSNSMVLNSSPSSEICEKTKKERNHVSRLFNQKLEFWARKACEQGAATSEGGAYCGRGIETAHITDKTLAEYLKNLFAGRRIGSFGEGLGSYKNILDPVCKVYDGYDGSPLTFNVSKGRVKFLDLSVPQYGLPKYDIVISMEVAEHIPAKFEQTYLDNLVRYSIQGIVLSWAVPGQGGYTHVNNRPLDYVVNQMKNRGFIRDPSISDKLKMASTLSWLKKNLNYYYRDKHVKS